MNKIKIGCIIQARMDSTRLPRKVLKKIVGKPLLGLLVDRLKPSKHIDEIIIATTINKKDQEIVDFCIENNIKYFRGSEEDVLDRYYQCAKQFNVDVIIRVTGDDPLIDYRVIDRVVKEFLRLYPCVDLVANDIPFTYPVGLNTHVLSFQALKRANEESVEMIDREHVVDYIINNPDKFKVKSIHLGTDYSSERWTLDYEEDYEFIKRVFGALYKENECFSMYDILKFLDKNPEVRNINKHLKYDYRYKIIKPAIEGGILTTNSDKLAEKARIYSLHGLSKDAWKRYSKEEKRHIKLFIQDTNIT